MESTKPVSFKQENEITIADLILRLQYWIKYLLTKWLPILICGLTGAGLGLLFSLNSKPTYTSELTFVLEDSKSSPFGAYAGIASQFGIDLGGTSGSGVFSGDNIIEFLKSRLMVEKTLLSPVYAKPGGPSLADLYVDINNLRGSWGDRPELAKISFPAKSDRNKLSLQQDSLLFLFYTNIIKNNLDVSKPDKKLGFISVKCKTKGELFSKVFVETLVREATDFYVKTKLKRSKATVERLQEKADSLEYLLNRKTYSLANIQDLNMNPGRNVAGVNSELVLRDKMVLQTMFAEVVKNLELSRMAMSQEVPIIQIVDTPILPLKKEKFGKLKGLVLGGFLAGLFVTLFFIGRKFLKDIQPTA